MQNSNESFIKKTGRFIKNNLIRIFLILMLLPFLTSYLFVQKAEPVMKTYNNMADHYLRMSDGYIDKASDAWKAYAIYQNFDQIVAAKESGAKSDIKDVQQQANDLKKPEAVGSMISSLLKGKKPSEVKDLQASAKAKVNSNLRINLRTEMEKQPTSPYVKMAKSYSQMAKNIFYKKDYIKLICWFLMIPAFSIITLLVVMLSYVLQHFAGFMTTTKNRIVLSAIQRIWIVNIILSIIAMGTFAISTQVGMIVFCVVQGLYVFELVRFLFGFGVSKCPICKTPTEE